ncbi:MAG: Fe-S protein assembly co-chaperone HscB [Burkholderiaceae bacterium]|nr:Fe-S protein assembly co-chaperone HscB [Burkholderiaceae bacterium]
MTARDHFSLFGLPVRFALDGDALERAWRAVQGAVHPDRFAGGTDAQRLLALQYSTRINEAHDTLRDPMRRAAYLCALNGVAVDAERNTAMPPEFLMQQMEWRESLEDASNAKDMRGLAQLEQEVSAAMAESELLIEHLLDRSDPDFIRAAGEVRQMMFLAKFSDQVREEQKRIERGIAANR